MPEIGADLSAAAAREVVRAAEQIAWQAALADATKRAVEHHDFLRRALLGEAGEALLGIKKALTRLVPPGSVAGG